MENLFQQVRNALPPEIQSQVKQLSFYSEGIFKRLLIGLEAALSQGDVNHVTGDVNFLAIFLSKRKTLLTVLDVGFMQKPSKFVRFFLRLFWIVLPARRAGIITTISHSTKAELLKYVSIDPAKVEVVYVPILSEFKQISKTFNKAKPVLLQIGTKVNKNVVRLVSALTGISCHLEIVGEIDDELHKQLENSKVDYSVSVNLSNQEILRKYIEADIVCFVSTYEGFGMPIVEANATGRVVVTSNILSMPEVGDDAAHYVDPYDVNSIRSGVLKVIEDDAYRDQLIANGFRNVKRFDVKQIASQYVKLYKKLVQG